MKSRIHLSEHFTYRKLLRFTLPSIAMNVFLYLYIIEPYTQVGCQVEFARKVTHHSLKERIDGLYTEVAEIMQ